MPGAPTDGSGYLHEAVLYDSDEEFLGVVVPFLQEGAAVGEPCLVALESSTTDPTAPSTLPVEAPPPATPQRETPPLDATDIEHLVFRGQRGGHERRDPRSPPVRFRLWSAPDRNVATVTDRDDGSADPFAGLRYLLGRVGSVAHPPALQPRHPRHHRQRVHHPPRRGNSPARKERTCFQHCVTVLQRPGTRGSSPPPATARPR